MVKQMVQRAIPDSIYLRYMYKKIMGRRLNLKHPKTFNERLQWLKIHDRNPIYTKLVDKYEAKRIIRKKIGKKYIIPTLAVWDKVDDIDFAGLPKRFVIKCTHNSGGVVVYSERNQLDLKTVKSIIDKGFNSNFYWQGREWPYKNVKPRIIVEQYMCDDSSKPIVQQELSDYKFYCFNGYVDCVMVCYDRASGDTKYYFFDQSWNLKRINKRGVEAPLDFTLPKPECLDEMISIAKKLSKGIPFVRVDLYVCDGKPYFGEMTFYPQSGFDPNYLRKTDYYFGNCIDLTLAYDHKKNKAQF